jgi:hypothetical protein
MLPAIQLNGSAGWVTHVCLGGHPVVGTVCARYERPTASPGGVDPEAETDPVTQAPEVRHRRAAGLRDQLAQGSPLAGAAMLMHGRQVFPGPRSPGTPAVAADQAGRGQAVV